MASVVPVAGAALSPAISQIYSQCGASANQPQYITDLTSNFHQTTPPMEYQGTTGLDGKPRVQEQGVPYYFANFVYYKLTSGTNPFDLWTLLRCFIWGMCRTPTDIATMQNALTWKDSDPGLGDATAAQLNAGRYLGPGVLAYLQHIDSFFPQRVTLYSDENYGGRSLPLLPGRYDVTTLEPFAGGTQNKLNFGNDVLSSLRVPAGWKVTLYANEGFSGASKVVTADTPSLPDFNDVASSLVITGPAQAGIPQSEVQAAVVRLAQLEASWCASGGILAPDHTQILAAGGVQGTTPAAPASTAPPNK